MTGKTGAADSNPAEVDLAAMESGRDDREDRDRVPRRVPRTALAAMEPGRDDREDLGGVVRQADPDLRAAMARAESA